MTCTADLIRFLVEKGVALDVALAAAEIADNARKEELAGLMSRDNGVTERDAHRRASDRARKQRSRDNLRNSRDGHVTGEDCCTAALVPQVKNLTSFSKDSKNLKSLTEDRVEALAASRPQTKRGTRLPDDWMPDDPDFANEILGNARAATELDKFRDYWKAQPGTKGVKLDWFATWRNWVRTANERGQPRQRNGKSQLMQAFDRLEERMNHAQEPDPEQREGNLFRLPLGSVR